MSATTRDRSPKISNAAERHRRALKAAARVSFTLGIGALAGGCIADPAEVEVEEPSGPDGALAEDMADAGAEADAAIDRQWIDDGGVDVDAFTDVEADEGLHDLALADAEVPDEGAPDAELGCRALIDEDWEAFTACCEREGWPSPACDVWGPPMPPGQGVELADAPPSGVSKRVG